MKRQTSKFMIVGLLILAFGIFWMVPKKDNNSKTPSTQTKTNSSQKTTDEPAKVATFNRQMYSTTQPGSLWWIVNKEFPAGATYVPNNLVEFTPTRPGAGQDERQLSEPAAIALKKMINDAEQDGVRLMLASGYRSYYLQTLVYEQNVQSLGQAEADRVSAQPGKSEHQTGLSLDIEPTSRECEIQICFGQMTEGKWVAEHAHRFGFIVRYPEGKESITGYSYEPWHLRYVGADLSEEMHRTNIQALEEFFKK